jgi:hypothetical protein
MNYMMFVGYIEAEGLERADMTAAETADAAIGELRKATGQSE